MTVDKSLTLLGEDSTTTIIDGGWAGTVVTVTADNVNISGFTIQNSGTSAYSGIYLYSSKFNTVSGNIISNNSLGIYLFSYSRGNNISGNIISNNWIGIYLFSYSNDNVINGNTISNNSDFGILLDSSSYNIIYRNNFIKNLNQAYEDPTCRRSNMWDEGTEGNYWSDFIGEDLDGDGIGDPLLPHLGIDNYPLMAPYDKMDPVADAGPDRSVVQGTTVIFDAGGSSDNVAIVSYEWDFGDGTTGTGVTITHTYVDPGTYVVMLIVKDTAGNSDADLIVVAVKEVAIGGFSSWLAAILDVVVTGIALAALICRSSILKQRGNRI